MLESPRIGGRAVDGGRGVMILGLVLGVLGFIFQSPALYALGVAVLLGALWRRARRPVRRI